MTLVPGDEAIDVPVVAREPVAIQAWPPKAHVLCGTNMSIILGVGGHYNARSWLNKLFFWERKIVEKKGVAIRGPL